MTSPPTVPLWITIASSLSIGSFIGSIITLYFSSIQRRREWVNDNKKQEWRELISALSQSFHYLLNYSPGHLTGISGEQQKTLLQADVDAVRVISDRIFIAPQLERENIRERWRLLVAENDWSRMVEYWNSLHGILIAAARKDLGIK